MISGRFWNLLDDSSVNAIETAALRLLDRGGVRVCNDGLLDELEAAGCRTDRPASRVFLPERLVRDSVAGLDARAATRVEIPSGWNPAHRMSHGGSYPHILDWPSGDRRLATKRDVARMAKMAHVMPEFARVGKCLACAGVDPRIEPLWHTLVHARITDKPLDGGEVFYAEYLQDLVRMAEVLSGRPGDRSLIATCDAFTQPLILEPGQAAMFVEKRRLGLDIVPATMPICGLSAPVTLAGGVTVALTELLAGWTLGRVIAPGLGAGGIVSSGILDMSTALPLFGTPETALMNAAVANICRRRYGIGVWAAVNYTDCKTPGLHAAFQKMFGLLGAAFGGGTVLPADGLLSAGQDYSPVEHLLEIEMGKATERFYGHFDVDDETLATGLILGQMAGESTNFLDTDHTMAHWRGQLWQPQWIARSAWTSAERELGAEREMMSAINARIGAAIDNYEPPRIDRAKIAELESIFRAAEKRLLGANMTPLDVD